jgi:hypothetical protein
MNLVEFRLDGSEDYRVLCVSFVPFTPAHLVSLLKNEDFFGGDDCVGWHNERREDALFFYASGSLSGVYVRQREVKVCHLTRGDSGAVMKLASS